MSSVLIPGLVPGGYVVEFVPGDCIAPISGGFIERVAYALGCSIAVLVVRLWALFYIS